MKIPLTGDNFRKLVRGETLEFVTGGGSFSIEISMQDIGFNVMIEAIKEAVNEKDQAQQDPNSGPAVS